MNEQLDRMNWSQNKTCGRSAIPCSCAVRHSGPDSEPVFRALQNKKDVQLLCEQVEYLKSQSVRTKISMAASSGLEKGGLHDG